jgi:hypothetical protein
MGSKPVSAIINGEGYNGCVQHSTVFGMGELNMGFVFVMYLV